MRPGNLNQPSGGRAARSDWAVCPERGNPWPKAPTARSGGIAPPESCPLTPLWEAPEAPRQGVSKLVLALCVALEAPLPASRIRGLRSVVMDSLEHY